MKVAGLIPARCFFKEMDATVYRSLFFTKIKER
jgi:hypothetical protein